MCYTSFPFLFHAAAAAIVRGGRRERLNGEGGGGRRNRRRGGREERKERFLWRRGIFAENEGFAFLGYFVVVFQFSQEWTKRMRANMSAAAAGNFNYRRKRRRKHPKRLALGMHSNLVRVRKFEFLYRKMEVRRSSKFEKSSRTLFLINCYPKMKYFDILSQKY